MANPAKRRATYEDLLAVPEHLVAEILDGELVTHPRPASLHALAATALIADLHGKFHRRGSGPGGWVILDEPQLHLHGDVVVPDLAGWRRERMPEMPDAPAFELCPDWICEVLSPSSERIDRRKKMPIYAREGVGYAWLVNPIVQLLEVYARSEKGTWELVSTHAADEKVSAVPFEAGELDLSELWRR